MISMHELERSMASMKLSEEMRKKLVAKLEEEESKQLPDVKKKISVDDFQMLSIIGVC